MFKLWGLICWEEKGHDRLWDLNIGLWLKTELSLRPQTGFAESRCCEDISWDHEDMSQGSRDARQEDRLENYERNVISMI